jgi:hypothetical protein
MDEFLTFEEQLAWVMQNKEAMGVEAFLKFMMDNREEFSSLQPKKGVPWKDHPLKWLTDNPDALSETTFGKMIDEWVDSQPLELVNIEELLEKVEKPVAQDPVAKDPPAAPAEPKPAPVDEEGVSMKLLRGTHKPVAPKIVPPSWTTPPQIESDDPGTMPISW